MKTQTVFVPKCTTFNFGPFCSDCDDCRLDVCHSAGGEQSIQCIFIDKCQRAYEFGRMDEKKEQSEWKGTISK